MLQKLSTKFLFHKNSYEISMLQKISILQNIMTRFLAIEYFDKYSMLQITSAKFVCYRNYLRNIYFIKNFSILQKIFQFIVNLVEIISSWKISSQILVYSKCHKHSSLYFVAISVLQKISTKFLAYQKFRKIIQLIVKFVEIYKQFSTNFLVYRRIRQNYQFIENFVEIYILQ